MHSAKALFSGLVAVALVAAPLSSASAAWRHRGVIPDVFGAAAAVVVGVATLATAPLAIIAGAGSRGYYDGPPGYAYGGSAREYYGGSVGYAYEGAPRGYYAPPPVRYYSPPRNYGPPSRDYPPRPRYYRPPPGY